MGQSIRSLQEARRHLQENGVCQPGVLDARLAQSWQRSLYAGLQPLANCHIPDPISGTPLDEVLHRSAELLAHAKPVMDFLYGQIRGSHCMVVLADAQCVVLHTQGDRAFLNRAQRVSLSPGSCWHEDSRGTNAVGTAVADRTPIRVRGGEHFLEQNSFLHCSAAPIFSAQGEVAGVIDISGNVIASQSHTLSMANMAARLIENSWLKASYPQHVRIHLHTRPEGLDTPGEGILVMTEDGILIGANQEAMRMLRMTTCDFQTLRLEGFLQERLHHLLRNPSSEVQSLRLPNRQRLYLRILYRGTFQAHWGLPTTTIEERNQGARSNEADALAAIDSGDSRWHLATQKVRRILNKPIPLLIQGESGAGKEVFARAVHECGSRRGKPFVAINCAAIPESLIEAELFGYAPGAYTGAHKEGGPGRIREAEGGTLFLDEIGDMPFVLQTRLLRVIQERKVTPLGGSPVGVDFALISATHQPLDLAMEEGRFRSDLFYRINGFSVHLPALRERDDFDELVARILRDFDAPSGVSIESTLQDAMRRYPWPGNLRQLSSTLQTACALLNEGELRVGWGHLADDMARKLSEFSSANEAADVSAAIPAKVAARASAASAKAGDQSAGIGSSLVTETARSPSELRALSHDAILSSLQASGGNVSRAARQLSISRETIYRHLRRSRGI
ncbi:MULTISPECIES: sigma-54-dependent Fis family transcriptional regulator [Pandoraea]|uniref:sigma-54-dependent Fis family transcriptional regulator n=1 Tax=Pandoraea TaxID=93217 RepID=UPI00041C656D|nr:MULTISPECIES: sigma-54-dependent Fis family transcriptional regulator [Pandoraea]